MTFFFLGGLTANEKMTSSTEFIKADKTTNYYKMEKEDYNEYMERNITKEYKKANKNDFKNVVKKDISIATKLDIVDRVYSTSKREAFITLKDHKPNYKNNPKFRLINPTNSFTEIKPVGSGNMLIHSFNWEHFIL